jgi:hypothetical protein
LKTKSAKVSVAYAAESITVTPAQLASWRGLKTTDNVALGGSCPTCEHDTLDTIPVRLAGFEAGVPGSPGPLTATVSCACRFPHDGRPADIVGGCGRSWTVQVIDDDDAVRLTPTGTDTDPVLLLAAQAAHDAAPAQLTDVRSAAEKWITAVTTITGLFGLTGVVVSRSTVASLSPLWQLLVGLGALTALVLAGVAVYLISRAAYGWPTTADVSDDAKLKAWYLRQQNAAFARAGGLKAGVRTAVVSLAALAATVGLLWSAPQQAPATPLTQATLTGGSRVCGTLLPATATGMATIRRASDGTAISIPLRSLTAVTAVSSC